MKKKIIGLIGLMLFCAGCNTLKLGGVGQNAISAAERTLAKKWGKNEFKVYLEDDSGKSGISINCDLTEFPAPERALLIEQSLLVLTDSMERREKEIEQIKKRMVELRTRKEEERLVPSSPNPEGDVKNISDNDAAEKKASSEKTADKELPDPPDTSGSPVFLWKPVSESDGKLVLLIPAKYNGQIEKVTVNGKSLRAHEAKGRNGNRSHWRASRPGATFGNNITVSAHLKNGSTKSWHVPNGGERKEI